jgi:hypothetical protein
MDNKEYIVFCDMENTELDMKYAEKLITSFRELTGWKVAEGTRIYNELVEFSKGYSKKQRNTEEVAVIFKIANGI